MNGRLHPLAPLLLAGFAPAQESPQAASAAKASVDVELTDAFPAQESFNRPLYLDHHASDPDHYYVVEQSGTVYRIPRDGESSEREVFLKLDDLLHPGNGGHNEEGLLGFAFDPDYGDIGRVYVYYSHKTGEGPRRRGRRTIRRESRLSRFIVAEVDGRPQVDPSSEMILMEIEQPWGNHNGGTILFGPDRMLYIALGDGGDANDRGGNGQNKGTLLATVLRIDVSAATSDAPYAVPADNPFVGEEGTRGEIWAYGLRNPWRISFDRATGDLWCGDVGQNLYEEVDRIARGGNYGWPLREAGHEFPPGSSRSKGVEGLIPPIAEYPRNEGISITGGYVYRGTKIPRLVGWYVYGDYQTRRLWAVHGDGEDGEHEVVSLGEVAGPLASFAEEPDGELLLLCFDGRIYRLGGGAR